MYDKVAEEIGDEVEIVCAIEQDGKIETCTGILKHIRNSVYELYNDDKLIYTFNRKQMCFAYRYYTPEFRIKLFKSYYDAYYDIYDEAIGRCINLENSYGEDYSELKDNNKKLKELVGLMEGCR